MQINRPALGLIVAGTVLAALSLTPVSPPLARALAAYILTMLVPGAALHLAMEQKPGAVDLAASSLLLSPIITAAGGVLGAVAGAATHSTTTVLVVLYLVAGVTVSWRARPVLRMTRADAVALFGLILFVCLLAGYMPYTEQWWRIRSDAWFHRGVIADIATYGLPPGDPYFAGVELQYMWFYHALHLTLSQATGLRPQWTMTLFNTQALAGIILAAFAFASVFRDRFSERIASAVTVVFGLSAAFWAFFPLRWVRALTGEVRGWSEIKRQMSLVPFSHEKAAQFVNVLNNPGFFLDKYIVPTAFSLGLSLTVMAWALSARLFKRGRVSDAVLLCFAFIGMFCFHTVVGAIMALTICGGVAVVVVLRNRVERFDARRCMLVCAAVLAAFAIASPYLYWITRLKDTSPGFPLDLSLPRIGGVLVAVTMVALLAYRQKSFWRARDLESRFMHMAIPVVILVALTFPLPDLNAFDKPSYFAVIPLALVGGWSVVAWCDRFEGRTKKTLAAVVTVLLLFAPVNLIGLLGCYFTPVTAQVSPDEHALAQWVRVHTGRNDVIIDHDRRVFLLVEGPRRYFFGSHSYARQWAYDKREMAYRYHTLRTLYAHDRTLDANSLDVLARFGQELYVVMRTDENDAGANVAKYERLFPIVYRSGELALARVDRSACAEAARSCPTTPDDQIMSEANL